MDTNVFKNIFLHDRLDGTTKCVSVSAEGDAANNESSYSSISGDGRYVVFGSLASNIITNDTNDTWDIFVHDVQTGITERISIGIDGSQGNSASVYPSISADGNHIAYMSYANNLVLNDTNAVTDVFVYTKEITISDIINFVRNLFDEKEILNEGIANSLNATLLNALSAVNRDDNKTAVNMLQAFINKVEAQMGNHITEEAAAILINMATQLTR